jgi:hypothetical protein
VNCLYGQDNLGNVESSNILREDFIFDEHGHQVSTRQKLHQHVEEVGVLEGCVELHDPRTVRLGQDISLGSHVCQLILLEHLRLDQGLHGVHLAIHLLLHQLDFAKGTFTNDLDGRVVFGLVFCPEEFPRSTRPALVFGGFGWAPRASALSRFVCITGLLGQDPCKKRCDEPLISLPCTPDTILEEIGRQLGAFLLAIIRIRTILVGIALRSAIELRG